jgi:rfaE bifunctional protein kinase chain/domain
MMLTEEQREQVLIRAPHLSIGVVGDLFLDRYLDLDATLTEPSIETGLDAYQIFRVRSLPGAAGTVVNNLVALGVGRVVPISLIGDDGEGYELSQALEQQRVPGEGIVRVAARRTPTYTKPMLHKPGLPPRELNRLDVHPRDPLTPEMEAALLEKIHTLLPSFHALALLDQVSRPNAGVLTQRVRATFTEFARDIPILADSRAHLHQFRNVMLKPNEAECRAAVPEATDLFHAAQMLADRVGKPVFTTRGAQGIYLTHPSQPAIVVPGVPVDGPIDPVGAGDSTTAGILTALAAGLPLASAAAFGCLVASVTVQQIGTTGTASPESLRRAHVNHNFKNSR